MKTPVMGSRQSALNEENIPIVPKVSQFPRPLSPLREHRQAVSPSKKDSKKDPKGDDASRHTLR
jgi:hypothetical protein